MAKGSITMIGKRTLWLMLAGILLLAISACQVGISRNEDGSLRIEAEMPESALEAEMKAAIADPLVEDVSVELHSGYLAAEASRRRLSGSGRDTMSFRLDLGAEDGRMTAVILEVEVDGFNVSQDRVQAWNQRIAANLERAGNRSDDSDLVDVVVTEEAVTLVWRVETARLRGE
ncbi:MAG: hypothetical protein ACLFWD_02215 [Anaerolineales bacterium]